MPRRNKRKHHKNEGRLGFNPDKYIAGSYRSAGFQHCGGMENGSMVDLRHPLSDNTPYYLRHKAHCCTMRRRRALAEIHQMHRSAERVIVRQNMLKAVRKPDKLTCDYVSTSAGPNASTAAETIPSLPAPLPEKRSIDDHSTDESVSSSVKTTSIFGGIKAWLKRIGPLA